jgi:hypothetical protein
VARPSRSAAVLARVKVTLPSLLLLRDLVPRADLLLLLRRLALGIRLRADGLDERRLPLLLLLLLPLPGGVAPTEEPKRTMLDRPVAAACSPGASPTKEEVKNGPRRGAVEEAGAGGAGGTMCTAWCMGRTGFRLQGLGGCRIAVSCLPRSMLAFEGLEPLLGGELVGTVGSAGGLA